MSDCQINDILSVTTTVADLEQARQLARAAVSARLAACVQVEPIESFYRWQGRLCEQGEQRLTFKTLAARHPALEQWLQAHHPYEQPQILTTACSAEAGYAAWVGEQVVPDMDDAGSA